MIYYRFIFLLLSFTSYLNAQVVQVKDLESKEVLEYVTVTSEKPKVISQTNSAGKVDLKSFSESLEITFQLLGYKKLLQSYDELKSKEVIYLEHSNIALDQVVVSASKWSQSNAEIPFKVSSILPREVTLQNPQTTADLLNTSGEIFIQKSQQGGGSPMIRGFATNRLLMTVDGVRMNTAIFRGGNIQNVISLDNFALQNVEILFGPGSVIYGSDAIGGVMSFYTLKPEFALDNKFTGGNIYLRTSSANSEITGHFDFNLSFKNLASLTSVTYTDYGDLKMGSYGPDEYLFNQYPERINNNDVAVQNENPKIQKGTGYSQINLMQKISYLASEKLLIDYGFHYSATSKINRYDRLIRTRNDLPRSAEWYYGPQIWMMNNLSITMNEENQIFTHGALRFAHQFFEESRHDRNFNDSIKYNRTEQVSAYSLNFDFTKNIDGDQNLFYGVEGIFNDVNSDGSDENILTNNSSGGASRYPNSQWMTFAGYLAYQNNLTKKLTLESGLRYTQYILNAKFDTTFYPFPFSKAEINDGSISANTGLTFNPDHTWNLRLNLSTGFRSPNVDDIGKIFDSEPGAVVVPNPSLKAEYAYNIDIGVAKVIEEYLKVDVTGFYTFLDNALVRRNFTINGLDSIMYDGELSQVQAIQNGSEAYVYGIQTNIDVKINRAFELSTSFNYQKGKEVLDDGSTSALRHAAPLFSRVNLSYSTEKLKVELSAIYNGEISYSNLASEERGKEYLYAIDNDGNPYSPSWYTLNLKAMYNFSNTISFSAGIENFTDQRYRPYSSGIAAAGRNFIISTKAKL